MTTIIMRGNTYEVRPESLLGKMLEKSTAQSLQRVGIVELVKILETTD
ncbi:19020_t:CDS:1, partial [Cetraspora pellucida]